MTPKGVLRRLVTPAVTPVVGWQQEPVQRMLKVMQLAIEIEREDDGRWIAEVPELPGVMAYGATREEACRAVQALALRVVADKIEHGEAVPSAALSLFAA